MKQMTELKEIETITQDIILAQTKIHNRQAELDKIFSEAKIQKIM